MTTYELIKMIFAVGQWAEYNFDIRYPELGIVEELGEFAHAQLKALQKIRADSSTEEKAKDALGDAAIFLFDYCHIHEHQLYEFKFFEDSESYLQPFAQCLESSSQILFYSKSKNIQEHFSHEVWYQLNRIAIALKWDLTSIIQKTWDEVKTRDWRKFPTNGKDA